MMQKYDHNIAPSRQTVKVTFMRDDYTVQKHAQVGGNCFGFDVMETAISAIYDELPTVGLEISYIEMENPDGRFESWDDDEERGYDWLKEMVVKVEIILQEPSPRPSSTKRG